MATVARVRRVDAQDKRGRRRFVWLERDLIGADPMYVPEIAAARCVPVINRRWQQGGREDTGFIGYFAAAPEAERQVAHMLRIAEEWLAERGVRLVFAPFSGDAWHGFATQVDAFDEPPMFPLAWQPPYYPALFEASGYEPALPFWVYEIDFASERYRAVSRAALGDARCRVRTFDKKRWKEELETLRLLVNETVRDEWEFHRMTREEYREFFDPYKPVFDAREFLFAEADGEAVGICFGVPDWTPHFRSFKGRMGPLQIGRFPLRSRRFGRGCPSSASWSPSAATTSARRSPPRSTATTSSAG